MSPFQEWAGLGVQNHAEELTRVKEEVLPPKIFVKATEAVGEVVERAVRGYKMMVCGSFAQGTAVSGSDLDISLVPVNKKKTIDREHGIQVLETLRDALLKTPLTRSNGLQVSETVFTASVPILRLEYTPLIGVHPSLPIDISIGNEKSGERDSIVKDILMKNPSVLLPLSIIKYWAKRRYVVKAYEGFPNSISWSLLFICHCQLIGLLPNNNNVSTWTAPSMLLSETQILMSFFGFLFQYSSDGTFGNFSCCVTTGSLVPRSDQGMLDQCPLWIVDPIDETNNVARSVKPHQWGVATNEAHRAFTMLTRFANFTDILSDKESDDTPTEGTCSLDEASSSASLPLSDESPTGRAMQWTGEAAAPTKFDKTNPTPGDCVTAVNLQKEVHINSAKGIVLENQMGTLRIVEFMDPPHGRLVIDASNVKVIEAEVLFPMSTMVQAHGLLTHKNVNGCKGIVVGFSEGCVLVQFPQPHGGMSVRPKNLYPIRTGPVPVVGQAPAASMGSPAPSPSHSTASSVGPRRSSLSSLASDPSPESCEQLLEYEVRPTSPPTYYCRSSNTVVATPPPGYHSWLGTTLFNLLSYMGHEAPKVTGMLLDAAQSEPYKVWSLLSSQKQLRAQAMVAAAHLHHHACRLRTQQPAQPSGTNHVKP